MTQAQKEQAMNKASHDLNEAKDRMDNAVMILESHGLFKDAEQLSRMILRVEQFQNKYNRFSIHNYRG